MYTSGTIANSQGMPTDLNKNGAIAKGRIFVKKTDTVTQPAIACSKLTIETLEQGVKHVQS